MNTQDLLNIAPSSRASSTPRITPLVRKMTAAYRQCDTRITHDGQRMCVCEAVGDKNDYILPNGMRTNSLCIHYLAYHLDEVPTAEREKINRLTCGEAFPTPVELATPGK